MISGILQARMIPELAEEDGADRKEDHAGDADRFIAGVERKQRENRGEANLLADETRLERLAREGRDGIEDQETDAAGGIAVQMLESQGICIGAHISSIADVHDRNFDPVKVSPAAVVSTAFTLKIS